MTTDTDSIPHTGFDPLAFWLAHKTKIIIYASLLILLVVGFLVYEISKEQKIAHAREALAQAASEEDLQAVIQKYPHTVAAGNASLMLASKLRDAKKYDDAVNVLKAMIDSEPSHPLIDGAWLSLATTYNAQGNASQAIDTYQHTANTFADRFSAPLALFSIAEILKAEGKIDEAKTAYENVKSQFPDSYFSSVALQKLQLLKK